MKGLSVHYEAPDDTYVSPSCPPQSYQARLVSEAAHQARASKHIAEKESQKGMRGTLKPTNKSLYFYSVNTLQSTARQMTALCGRPRLPTRPPRHTAQSFCDKASPTQAHAGTAKIRFSIWSPDSALLWAQL